MKSLQSLLLVGITAAFCCSIANAQLIYSNYFIPNPSLTNSLSGNGPTAANTIIGGTNTARWICTYSNALTGYTNGVDGTVLVNGTIGTNQGCVVLPFLPKTNHVYCIDASVTMPAGMGDTIEMGFTQTGFPTNNIGFTRFNDTGINGYAWTALKTGATGTFFGGAKTANTDPAADLTPVAGTYTFDIILNTISAKWTAAAYVNGAQMGTNLVYAVNPPIAFAGLGQAQFATTSPAGIQWNYWTLSGALQPFITKQPTSQSVGVGVTYSNVISVITDPGGGTLSYQWFTNGVPLANSASVSGANSNVLVISPVAANNACTNCYVVVTNNFGSATSAVVSLTVFVTTTITAAYPVAYTNPITLLGGTNITGTNYAGSSPTFSVTVAGSPPLAYQWFTNGVVAGAATNSSFTFVNCQFDSPTNFTCIVTNSHGAATNSWPVTYIPTPEAPYPQAVLAAQPVAFWRLNEASGNLCDDYQSGNNGIYTNAIFSQTGYNQSEMAETSVGFGMFGTASSYAGQIQGVDFAITNGANAEFTVEAWANCSSGGGSGGGAPVVTKGVYALSDAFALGVDTNSPTQFYQFYVRSANGAMYTAHSSIPAADLTWHHLAGVCDEANSNISLYIDGNLAASAYIPAKSGSYEVAMPIAIGAGIKVGSATYNLQFTGDIDDVAAYNYALGAATVTAEYIAETGGLGPVFSQTPVASVTVNSGGNLAIAADLIGSAPMGYFWTDVNGGTNVASGATNSEELNASLVFNGVPDSWNGDQLELTVTNAYETNSLYVAVYVVSGLPQIQTDVVTPFWASLGGASSNSVTVAGSLPIYYQWQFNGTNLMDNGRITGSQSSMLTISGAQIADQGGYQVVITNSYGAITSSMATFVVVNDQPVGFNNNGPGWQVDNVVNISSLAITNGLLTLTDGGASEARGFFFEYPLYIGAFQASFTYQDVNGAGADGAAFVLQNDPRGPAAAGGDGGRVGVGSGGGDTGASVAPSWELELHIYSPAGVGYAFETQGAYGPPWLPTGYPGDANYAAETNMLASSDPINVTLNYASGMMSLVMTDAVAGVSFSTNEYIGDLTQIVNGNTAYVGFTAGDGGATSVQTITNFSFVSITPAALQLSGTNALILWPGSIVGYTLQENADLTTTNWVNVTNLPTLTNGMNGIVVPAGVGNLFYRLILP